MLENGTSSTIQCGRRINDKEIGEIRETVDLCRRLSRYELARTIAENLGWYTASGSLKVDACVRLLEKLQAAGVLQLPEKRVLSRPNKRSILITARTAPVAAIGCKLKQLDFVQLQVVSEPQDIKKIKIRYCFFQADEPKMLIVYRLRPHILRHQLKGTNTQPDNGSGCCCQYRFFELELTI